MPFLCAINKVQLIALFHRRKEQGLLFLNVCLERSVLDENKKGNKIDGFGWCRENDISINKLSGKLQKANHMTDKLKT